MTSRNALDLFYFDTQWHLSQKLFFSRQYVLFSDKRRKIGHPKSRHSRSIKMKSTLFQPHFLTSHSKGNFEYFALYYFTHSTRCMFSKTKSSNCSVLLLFLVRKVERKIVFSETCNVMGI